VSRLHGHNASMKAEDTTFGSTDGVIGGPLNAVGLWVQRCRMVTCSLMPPPSLHSHRHPKQQQQQQAGGQRPLLVVWLPPGTQLCHPVSLKMCRWAVPGPPGQVALRQVQGVAGVQRPTVPLHTASRSSLQTGKPGGAD
jgi:hypothetical protein